MSAWYILTLIAGLGTMACFAGAIPLYFRKGTAEGVENWWESWCHIFFRPKKDVTAFAPSSPHNHASTSSDDIYP
jgi:hypothetical protein